MLGIKEYHSQYFILYFNRCLPDLGYKNMEKAFRNVSKFISPTLDLPSLVLGITLFQMHYPLNIYGQALVLWKK